MAVETKVTHTPGPWIAEIMPRIGNYAGSFSVEVEGLVICARAGVPSRASESAANAHLIAAAPDLLDVVKRLMTLYTCFDGERPVGAITAVFDDARAAIAKAEGT
jgi:hypothetical protein